VLSKHPTVPDAVDLLSEGNMVLRLDSLFLFLFIPLFPYRHEQNDGNPDFWKME